MHVRALKLAKCLGVDVEGNASSAVAVAQLLVLG